MSRWEGGTCIFLTRVKLPPQLLRRLMALVEGFGGGSAKGVGLADWLVCPVAGFHCLAW